MLGQIFGRDNKIPYSTRIDLHDHKISLFSKVLSFISLFVLLVIYVVSVGTLLSLFFEALKGC